MRLLPLFLIALLACFSCDMSSFTGNDDAEVTDVIETPIVEIDEDEPVSTTRSTTSNPMYNDLMQPEAGGVYRGVYFNMKRGNVLEYEESRMTTSIYKDEIPEELVITTDMGKEVLDFADVTYKFDEQGLYSIMVESYNVSLEGATAVYDLIVEKYTEKYGEPEIAEDGFAEFIATDAKSGLEYQISVKNIDDVEDSFGLYLYFDLL